MTLNEKTQANDMLASADILIVAEQENPRTLLRVASERLSTVRYVFVVAIEDGIAGVEERSALEYSDAVLIGWPDNDANDVQDAQNIENVAELVMELEKRIVVFREAELNGDAARMADTLIHISEYVARVRKAYQPDFLLPTYAEIRRYVQRQWDEEEQLRADEEAADNANGSGNSNNQAETDATNGTEKK
ncbi:hypothetical protein QP849_07210 [Alloscardovia omnicolens]|uniref:hypothetical protein n=1 Tax=Alloscardovia omnicolens TaxID=419015 RepID=UPI0015E0D673|nr:hypothetical protein [Alloscardovia omnicolens]MDK8650189.1 hypothetical protein [Alloscardovia omnicolens]